MRRSSIYAAALALLAVSIAGACSGTGPGPNVDPPAVTTRELIRDAKFKQGISVSALNSHAFAYTWWKFDKNDDSDPVWSLGQYCDLSQTRNGYDSSVNDLSLGNSLLGSSGNGIEGKEGDAYTLTNRSGSKYLAVDPVAGKATLAVDTSKEYVDQTTQQIVPRSNGEDWVHMILEQTAYVKLAETESVTMSLDFTLNSDELIDAAGGASQFQWIFSVHDKEHSTATNAEYFWFNVTLYDNRYEVFPGTDMFDGGKADSTGKYIYAPRGDELFGESGGKVEVGVKHHVEIDLKSYMKTAFEKAQSKGALPDSSWEDMSINGFNIGWEVTNVSAVSVTIENLSLTVKEKTQQ